MEWFTDGRTRTVPCLLGVDVVTLDPAQAGEVSALSGVDEGVCGGLQGTGRGHQMAVAAPEAISPAEHGQVPVGHQGPVLRRQRLARREHRPVKKGGAGQSSADNWSVCSRA